MSLRPCLPVLILAAAFTAGGCSKSPSAAAAPAAAGPTKIIMQLDWVAEPEHGGFYQAQAKGYFRDAGLDVTINQGGANAFAVQKVATNQAQIGEGDSTNLILAINQGLPLINVAALFQNDPSVLMLHADNPVQRFEDLDGKTIMARPEWAFLPYLKNKYHISFNIIPQNFAVGNFIADRNFIQQGFYIAEPYYIMKGGAKQPKFLFAWDAGFDAYTVLCVNRPWAEAHAPQVKAFLAAFIHGWKDYLEGDPTPANTLMKQLNPHNTDEFLAFSRKMIIEGKLAVGRTAKDGSDLGRITPERFGIQLHQLEELGILPKGKLTVDQVMTTAYLP